MAGCPTRRQHRAILAALTEGDVEDIFDRVAAAQPLDQIADLYQVSRRALCDWFEGDPDRHSLYTRARTQSAGMRVERADKAAAEATPETVGVAKLRIQQEQWVAGRLDRETYGERSNTSVTINMATLHIDALRKAGPVVVEQKVIEAGSE